MDKKYKDKKSHQTVRGGGGEDKSMINKKT